MTAAFGDPTRREIFLHLRTPGATATEVAAAFSLHPNVARHHLDRLVAGRYLRVERAPGRRCRPPVQAVLPGWGDLISVCCNRRDDLMVNLLREALELLGPEEAERMAAKVGEDYGRAAGRAHVPGRGPALGERRHARHRRDLHRPRVRRPRRRPRRHHRGSGRAVPLRRRRHHHPVLCAVDRGMVKGLLAGLCGEAPDAPTPVVLSSRARGDDTCAAQA